MKANTNAASRLTSSRQGPPGKTAVDFWDVGASAAPGQTGAPTDAAFSEVVEVRSPGAEGKGRAVVAVVAVLLLAAGGWAAYEYFMMGRNPLDTLTALIEGGEDEDGEESSATGAGPVANAPVARPAGEAPAKPKVADHVAGNPYWSLPNRLLGKKAELERMWSAEEEETWRAALAHKYAYQRWQTVQEIRKKKLRGSDAALWDAMQDKKLWTRMWAAVGLAEMNVEVSLNSLEGALGKERSELVADFFERFVRRPSPGQAFIMRQVVRLLDEKGRLVVLSGIDRAGDELRDLYMVAATLDPGKRVQSWVTRRLAKSPIPDERMRQLLDVVEGKTAADVAGDGKPEEEAAKDEKPLRLATGRDIDDGDAGDVEFYEEKPAAEEKTDDKTFDYDYEQ